MLRVRAPRLSALSELRSVCIESEICFATVRSPATPVSSSVRQRTDAATRITCNAASQSSGDSHVHRRRYYRSSPCCCFDRLSLAQGVNPSSQSGLAFDMAPHRTVSAQLRLSGACG